MNLECVTLEDGLRYVAITTIADNNNNYIYLSEENNPSNFCIRKIIKQEENEFIIPLDNNEEFDKALNLFKEKNC